VRGFVRVGDPATNLARSECSIAPLVERVQIVLAAHERIREVAEKRRRFVALLGLTLGKIDALCQKAARRSSLEALNFETQLAQAIAECRDGIAEPAASLVSQAHMKQAAHECAGRDHHCTAIEAKTEIGFHALDAVFADHESRDISLLHVEVWLALEKRLHAELIGFLIALRARSPNAWTLRGIQHAELNPGRIGVQPHRTAEGIDLPDNVALRQTANRRVTGHLPDRVGILREQEGFAAQPRGCHRCFDTGMTGTYNDDIVILWINEVAQITDP